MAWHLQARDEDSLARGATPEEAFGAARAELREREWLRNGSRSNAPGGARLRFSKQGEEI